MVRVISVVHYSFFLNLNHKIHMFYIVSALLAVLGWKFFLSVLYEDEYKKSTHATHSEQFLWMWYVKWDSWSAPVKYLMLTFHFEYKLVNRMGIGLSNALKVISCREKVHFTTPNNPLCLLGPLNGDFLNRTILTCPIYSLLRFFFLFLHVHILMDQ
jgi:hypothetical protein